MTTDTPYSLAQLAQILSALENERRNPNSKTTAIKAIERNAAEMGLSIENVLDAADGLLSGRLSAAEWRAQLRDEPSVPVRGSGPASFVTEAPAEPVSDDAAGEPAKAYLMPNAGRLVESGSGDDTAADVAEAAENAPVATTAAVAAKPETTETRVGVCRNGTHSVKEQLLAACRAAEHWLQAQRDRPGETRPDEILRVLRAAIARAEGQRQPREPRRASRSSRGRRENTKEAQVIAMLRRPEGATIAQIMTTTGWQAHTCRGFFAAALKKRHGLTVTSEKPQGGERSYRIAE